MSLRLGSATAAIVALFGVAPVLAQSVDSSPPEHLDAFVLDVMRIFEVPGLAIAIVKDGETVLARGYGVRHIDVRVAIGIEQTYVGRILRCSIPARKRSRASKKEMPEEAYGV